MSLKAVGAVSNVLNFDLTGLNNGRNAVIAMQFALKGLTADQVAAASSTLGLDAAQTAVAMNAVGATASEAALILATKGYSKEAVLAALATAGYADNIAAAAVEDEAFAAAQVTAAGATGSLTASLAAATKGMITFLTTNPVGWAILAAGAIAGLVAVYDALHVSFEEAADAAHDAQSEFEEASQEAKSLESELESVQQKIKELESKDGITLVEEAELAKLKTAEESLNRQYEIQQKVENFKRQEAAKAAAEALTNQDFKVASGTREEQDEYGSYEATTYTNVDILDKIKNDQDTLNEIQNQRAQYEKQLNELLDKANAEEGSLNPGNFLGYGKGKYYDEYNRLTGMLNSLDTQETSLSQTLTDELTEANTLYASLLDENGEAVEGYGELAQKCSETFDYVLDGVQIATEKQNAIDEMLNGTYIGIKNKLQEAAPQGKEAILEIVNGTEGLEAKLEEAGITVDEFCQYIISSFGEAGSATNNYSANFEKLQEKLEASKGQFTSLSKEISAVEEALSSQSTGESISVDTFNSDELKAYSSALEYTNGVLQLNAEKVSEIVKQKTQEAIATNDANKAMTQSQYMENARQIEKLREKIRDNSYEQDENEESVRANIDALLDENKTLKASCDSYDLLNQNLREATDAYHTWLNAQSAAESGDMFDGTLEAINHINETLNDTTSELFGRVGREDYKAAVNLIVPEDIDPEDKEKVNKYLEQIHNLFTYNDDGERAGLNIENFCKEAVDSGLMVLDESTNQYKIAGQKTMEDFAEGMNLSMPLVQAMFGEMEEFGGKFSWADEVDKTFGDMAVSANVAAENIRTNLKSSIEETLNGLGEGGTVNLTVRPKVDTSKLNEVGWDAGEGIATVFSSTYSNEAGNIAINFTPIIADPKTGEYIGVLSPDELQEYAEGVIAGTREDDLNLQIGGVFTGEAAIEDAESAAERIHELHEKYFSDEEYLVKLDFSDEDLDTDEKKLAAIQETIDEMNELKAILGVDSSEVEYANSVISYCVAQKQQLENPAILNVDASKVEEVSKNAADAVTLLQQFKTEYNSLQIKKAIGIDTTDAEAKVEELRKQISETENDYIINLDLDTASVENLNKSITELGLDTIKSKLEVDDTMLLDYVPEDKEATVKYDIDTSKVDAYNPKNLTRYVTYYTKTVGENSKLSRDRDLNGTADAGGNWGANKGGRTLVGELGREIVVNPYTGKWYTVGDNGAEFINLPKGSIVFNNKQTEELLKNGSISSRASQALASGTAFVTGGIDAGSATDSTKTGGNSTSKYKKNSSSKKSSDTSDDAKDELQKVDWIEVAIDRIERSINKLKRTAESAYKSLKTKLGAAYDEIAAVNAEIALQQQAYERYMQEAASVGLPDDLVKLVQNGSIDISEYDSDTQDLISDYQEMYEKALDASDAVDELHETLASLYEDNFNNIQEDFDNQLGLLEHLTNTYETGLDELEAKGYLIGTSYYAAMQEVERKNIAIMEQELASLITAFSEAMASGEIEEGSSAWYEMQQNINGVKEAIAEANVKILEFAKSMREVEWEHFDYLQDRISNITQESDFLIDLMGHRELYQDNGKFTDEGMATLGLHAQNYNVYMAQADEYANEIKNLDSQIASDPYNKDLIERREELLGLQQDAILAAEDEKDAMIEMVEDGIEYQIDAMNDLIDSYKDSLDSAKDLYEYQKKVAEQTKKIADIEKQLAAYEGDDSEETKATVQKLRTDLEAAQEDLEETEYDKFVSDTKALLDNLQIEFEDLLNNRMDNVDALLADIIDMVNANAFTVSDAIYGNTSSISETLERVSDDVGYTMTTEMHDIWNSQGALGDVVALYGDNFLDKMTTINSVLESIRVNTANMVAASEALAQERINSAKTTTTPDPSVRAPTTNKPSTNTNTPTTQQATPAKSITVGGKINAGSAPIYDYAGDTSGEHQYYASDPIYTVLREKNGYIQVRHHSLSSGITGWFKKSDVKAYKTGGLVDYTGIAKVDGTPGKPELVLNARDTQNFIELKDILSSLAQHNLSASNSNYGVSAASLSGLTDISGILTKFTRSYTESNSTVGDIVFDISIDHVQDYNDFVTQLQHDSQFERMVRSMTTDRLGGGSSLAKYKYNWSKEKDK